MNDTMTQPYDCVYLYNGV